MIHLVFRFFGGLRLYVAEDGPCSAKRLTCSNTFLRRLFSWDGLKALLMYAVHSVSAACLANEPYTLGSVVNSSTWTSYLSKLVEGSLVDMAGKRRGVEAVDPSHDRHEGRPRHVLPRFRSKHLLIQRPDT